MFWNAVEVLQSFDTLIKFLFNFEIFKNLFPQASDVFLLIFQAKDD